MSLVLFLRSSLILRRTCNLRVGELRVVCMGEHFSAPRAVRTRILMACLLADVNRVHCIRTSTPSFVMPIYTLALRCDRLEGRIPVAAAVGTTLANQAGTKNSHSRRYNLQSIRNYRIPFKPGKPSSHSANAPQEKVPGCLPSGAVCTLHRSAVQRICMYNGHTSTYTYRTRTPRPQGRK